MPESMTPSELIASIYEHAVKRGVYPSEAGRLALRALAECFQDKVVKNAILAAASEGEQE